MEFLVLVPLQTVDSRRPEAITAPRQRALLASLLMHANEVASTDRSLSLAWGEDQLEPSALRCHLLNSRDTCAAFHVAATGYEIEPNPLLE
jgi:DNA-binding SARP family transcriptional activator